MTLWAKERNNHMLVKHWRWPWLRTGLLRAMGETLLLQTVVLLLWLLFFPVKTINEFLSESRIFFVLYGPCCVFWAALRLYLPGGSWWQKTRREALFTAVFLLENSMSVALAVLIIPLVRTLTIRVYYVKPSLIFIEPFVIIALGCCLLFVAIRIGAHVLVFWDRLRRTRLRWALTHAQVLVVGLAVFLLAVVAVLLSASFIAKTATYGPLLAVLLLFCLFIFIMTVLLILPPFALFSYLFVRPITKRIEQLAMATTALRAGDYQVRVSVTGEDEVARLQADFNAMAVDLERTMHELQRERDTVATLLHERRELIANVSHDLRTPVATLRGYLESSLARWNGQPPATLQQDLHVMEHQTLRLQALIDDLFLLSRTEVRQLELYCVPTDVKQLAERVVNTIAPLAWNGSKIELLLEAASQVPLALVDGARLEQVLQNLLHNAIRHTPPGGIVAVLVDLDSDADKAQGILLQVKDTGEGIALAHLPHVWDRFYRVSNGAAPSSGAGLGLAIVKELTEAMGGRVAVTSVVGEGACFTLHLPMVGV